jgi:N-acetylmuramic acid 6-phosphate etherase
MVDMQLTNKKLSKRAVNIVMEKLNVGQEKANNLLKKYNSVRLAIKHGNS